MLNIISIIIGIFCLFLAMIAFLPFIGAANWLIVPIALLGVLFGALSSQNSGRNFCLIVTGLCIVRLWLGGGIF